MKQRSLFSKPKSDTSNPKPDTPKPVNRPKCNRTVENDRFTQPFLEKMKLTNSEDIKIYEEIQRHRLQILVWSKLYYDMDTSVVSDNKFDTTGRRLISLQAQYPHISEMVAYADEFRDWDASSGYNLPLQDPWVCKKAKQFLELDRRN